MHMKQTREVGARSWNQPIFYMNYVLNTNLTNPIKFMTMQPKH